MGALVVFFVLMSCVYGWYRLDIFQRHNWNRTFWNVLIWGAVAATLWGLVTGHGISVPSDPGQWSSPVG